MRRIKFFLIGSIAFLTGAWMLADTLLSSLLTYFSFRTAFMQYSGIIAMGTMSFAMVLALRPKWLEPHLNGLDKVYRLHKWLGITALAVAVLHWWWGQGTKWMVGWGWLTRPVRRAVPLSELGLIEAWLRAQRGLAEQLGEWAFYAMFILLVIALAKMFPYSFFRKTHKWLAMIYLVFVYHALVLIKYAYWTQPIGWVMAMLLIAGIIAAVLTLCGRIGRRWKARGVVQSLNYYAALRVTEIGIHMQGQWQGHAAGQFAFLTCDAKEGPHPYTIASAWHPDERRMTFIAKALGDYTNELHEHLKIGMPVTIEGPYGCFDFQDMRSRQIWVGAGIGITPFVARLKQLAEIPGAKDIDLFHPTAVYEKTAIEKLMADAKAAGVRLHILSGREDGRLDGQWIRTVVPEWITASVWFCGPPRFGAALREDFLDHRMPSRHFHQELFEMR